MKENKKKPLKKIIISSLIAVMILAFCLTAYVFSPNQRAMRVFAAGEEYLTKLDYEQAFGKFKEAVDIAPSNGRIRKSVRMHLNELLAVAEKIDAQQDFDTAAAYYDMVIDYGDSLGEELSREAAQKKYDMIYRHKEAETLVKKDQAIENGDKGADQASEPLSDGSEAGADKADEKQDSKDAEKTDDTEGAEETAGSMENETGSSEEIASGPVSEDGMTEDKKLSNPKEATSYLNLTFDKIHELFPSGEYYDEEVGAVYETPEISFIFEYHGDGYPWFDENLSQSEYVNFVCSEVSSREYSIYGVTASMGFQRVQEIITEKGFVLEYQRKVYYYGDVSYMKDTPPYDNYTDEGVFYKYIRPGTKEGTKDFVYIDTKGDPDTIEGFISTGYGY